MQSKTPNRLILLGRIGAAHGIKGDVSIKTFTGEPDAIGSYGPLTDKAGTKAFKVRVVRVTPKGVVARIHGVDDRNGAEALNGTDLYVERTRLPKAKDSEYYHADLLGLKAVNREGVEIGIVVAVENFGAGDLLEIQLAGGSTTEFVPFTNACVPDVDLATGRATIIMPVMTGDPEPASGEEDEAAGE